MELKFQSFTKQERFRDLISSVNHCNLCPRMDKRIKVLSKQNGNIHSKVMFVAEAPGRLGADRTGIPLFGDRTGDNFDRLLSVINWKRGDIFLLNAVLCNPRAENGNNTTPSQEEIANCLNYLQMTIDLIHPEVIVTLGRVALESLRLISNHEYTLKTNVSKVWDWNGYKLYPLYHPGPRALIHRSLSKQTTDFKKLSEFVDPLRGIKLRPIKDKECESTSKFISQITPFHQIIYLILSSLQEISFFKLTKLLYLIDLYMLENYGKTLTSEVYLRQKDGPWLPNLRKAVDQMNKKELILFFRHHIPHVKLNKKPRFEINIPTNYLEASAAVLTKYGTMNNSSIKIAVYRTKPMQYILAEEKKGLKMTNQAVIYKDKTIVESMV